MDALLAIWSWFADNILTQPAYFIGCIVVVGYALLKKPIYDIIAGFIKAVIGYQILLVGSGGLVSAFRPVLVGLKARFNLSAMVIDPYFGQNAVQAGMEDPHGPAFIAGHTFSSVMFLLLFAFVLNIILVALKRYTKCRALFTTGHVQVQQATTAFWLVLFCFPQLNDVTVLAVMTVLLGVYWAVGANLCIGPTQDLTDGAGLTIAHQQMFGVYVSSRIAAWMGTRSKKRLRRIEDIQMPGFLKIFNENLVSTAILMTVFFGAILVVLGKPFLVEQHFMTENQDFLMYILTTSFSFAVYLSILQLGVRTFVTELTNSFHGISSKLLKGSVPGVDCAVTYGFGSPNAVTVGFLFGALGQFLAIAGLLILKSPVVVIAGFVPLFFDNATIGVYANNKGGLKACIVLPFVSGLLQVFGSALIAGWVGMAAYGGYLGMWDWAVVWPVMTGVMRILSFAGLAIVVIALLAIPQLQYRANRDTYFMEVEDYPRAKRMRAERARAGRAEQPDPDQAVPVPAKR
ncbi:PTS system IIC component, L-Asc family [Coriobacterium glomerans PW2]|uniref:Ascorbate-specific PTS system EIIC component n=1 Tax=Coriobacterium glomerans (strain ATCC 49209 / DSM 20642 / JCM 10262 / PW2) TaxID=700015 RepID=F2N7C4_CORGP|nr:PTS ascorbate transporter subunit IIC [Coriobacterium glomerans]AEB06599.1 PTS system IIC component, L-Asc family [Coriobacterium glomerans PW2]